MNENADGAFVLQPAGWQNAAPGEVFELSDFDQIIPKFYTQIVLVFGLDDRCDKTSLIENLKAGLEVSLGQYAPLAGTLQVDSQTGKASILRKKEDTVSLGAKYLDSPNDAFPSFEELDKGDFPASELDGALLLQNSVTANSFISPLGADNNDTAISSFQITFIRGGVVLGLAVHHSCSDGPGCDGFLSTWAENCRALKNGTPIPSFNTANLDRSGLTSTEAPSVARMEELTEKLPLYKHSKAPMAPPGPESVMPEMLQVMYHFPSNSMEKLKARAKPKDENVWISTYDAILAIIWKAVTKARLPMYEKDQLSDSMLVHAVNIRGKLNLPDRLLANAVALGATEHIDIQRMLEKDSLPDLALAVRLSTLSVTHEHIREVREWSAGTPDKRGVMFNLKGLDLPCTSWQAMNPYTLHDFGFGLPAALRFPKPGFSAVFVYPRRVNKNDREEGIEVCVSLERDCQERLLLDEELKEYAYPRGV